MGAQVVDAIAAPPEPLAESERLLPRVAIGSLRHMGLTLAQVIGLRMMNCVTSLPREVRHE